MHQPRGRPNALAASLLRRVAAGQLSCPYCEDALRATVISDQQLQLRCPTCGFTEKPDRLDRDREP